MSFLSGAFLAGLAAMAIPIVIHLIHRQRYPDRNFPTLRFFDKTIKHNTLQKRLIDRLLLALRVLALGLLAIGLARPFWHSSIGERRMSVVIVLDNSPSMARLSQGKPLLDKARNAVTDVLDRLTSADRVEILLTSPLPSAQIVSRQDLPQQLALRDGQPTALLVGGENGSSVSIPAMTTDSQSIKTAIAKAPAQAPITLASFDNRQDQAFGYDHARLRTLLDSVKISSLPGDMRSAVANAGKMLAQSSDGDRKIIVVSDLQASDWRGERISQFSGLDVNVLTLDPDAPLGPNLGIENGTVTQPLAGLGQQVSATFTVRNYGKQASGQATLRVIAGDRGVPIETKVPPIAPQSSMLLTVPIRVSGRDYMLCTATLVSQTDPFSYDNTWNFQIGVRPPITALCVNGTAGANGVDKSTFFVMNALATRGGGAAPSADARECEVDDLKNQKLFQYAVMLLADVPSLDADARQKVRQFVSDGGGLLIFANPNATADEYNGWDFLPARISAQKKKTFLYVRAMAERATAVADVRRRAGSTVHALSTDASLALEPADGSTVLARFSDGSPALIEGRIGKGRVVVVGTSCHASRSDWPLQPAFVLLVRELVQYLGNGGIAAPLGSQHLVGDSAAMTIAAERKGGTPALFRVASASTYESLPWYRDNGRLMMPGASEPGHYLLTVRPDAAPGLLSEPGLGADVTPISVNHDPRESDLAPGSIEMIKQQLPSAHVTLEPNGATSIAELHSGRDMWRLLLACALLFLVVEGLMAWRWASEST